MVKVLGLPIIVMLLFSIKLDSFVTSNFGRWRWDGKYEYKSSINTNGDVICYPNGPT